MKGHQQLSLPTRYYRDDKEGLVGTGGILKTGKL
jgi:hypothetical protein